MLNALLIIAQGWAVFKAFFKKGNFCNVIKFAAVGGGIGDISGMEKFRIMFVCHGNICRSPMAEFIMKDIVRRAGRADAYLIASSATSTEEIGNPVYPPARRELLAHGIDPSGKVAVQLARADLNKYDMFIGMDSANIRNMRRMLGEGAEDKIYLMMSFVGSDADVADPWYCGGFDRTYADVYRACAALFERLEKI